MHRHTSGTVSLFLAAVLTGAAVFGQDFSGQEPAGRSFGLLR